MVQVKPGTRKMKLETLNSKPDMRRGRSKKSALSLFFGIVNGGRKKLYIQSAYKIPDESKREQETRGLRRIPDSFGKLVIVDGTQPFYTDEYGISYVSLMDFLLKPEIIA